MGLCCCCRPKVAVLMVGLVRHPLPHQNSERAPEKLDSSDFLHLHREPSFPMTFTTGLSPDNSRDLSKRCCCGVVVLLLWFCGEWVQCGALAGEGIKAAQSSASYIYASPPPLSHFIHISALSIVIVVESMLIPYCANRQIRWFQSI
ncbi:hypothetical protein Ddc_09670 [Ditylenchus destructor]|nr:hypothetical protein Ddc_09670 [Ditylenchus destructor]